ncbi:hypothetical protein CHS0354_042984 [Potamilus streckersoni]|uniref:B box-type domain-containing protein n=1 Tax=Potamilus streckersoni TaxID=2493646 RepID=A0AAE0T454_9BIVA|nr:hypothetical protein CHS0354_042984 [Potamilus streckersoni]
MAEWNRFQPDDKTGNDSRLEAVVFCLIHTTNQITCYCQNCIVLLCDSCLKSRDSHSFCTLRKLCQITKEYCSTARKTITTEIENLTSVLNALHEANLPRQRLLVTKREQVSLEISQYFSHLRNRINESLLQQEHDLHEELTMRVQSEENRVKETLSKCDALNYTFQEQKTFLENLDAIYNKGDNSVFEHLSHLTQIASSVRENARQTVELSQSKRQEITIRFFVNMEIENILLEKRLASVEVKVDQFLGSLHSSHSDPCLRLVTFRSPCRHLSLSAENQPQQGRLENLTELCRDEESDVNCDALNALTINAENLVHETTNELHPIHDEPPPPYPGHSGATTTTINYSRDPPPPYSIAVADLNRTRELATVSEAPSKPQITPRTLQPKPIVTPRTSQPHLVSDLPLPPPSPPKPDVPAGRDDQLPLHNPCDPQRSLFPSNEDGVEILHKDIDPIGPVKKLHSSTKTDKRQCGIFGIAIHREDRLLIVDRWNRCVKHFDENGAFYGFLSYPDEPWDITKISDGYFAVAVPSFQVLFKFRIMNDDNMERYGAIQTQRKYASVSYLVAKNQFVCGVVPQFGDPLVDLINMEGNVLKTFQTSTDGCQLFSYPRSVEVSSDGLIVVCDWNKKCIIMCNANGGFLGTYTGTQSVPLREPMGIYVDLTTDRVYVIDAKASNSEGCIHVLSCDGQLKYVLRGHQEFRDGRSITARLDKIVVGTSKGVEAADTHEQF